MKLSVIIPARNEASRISITLNETHSFLQKQNYPYEIIVVDGHSTDNTREVVQKLFDEGVVNARLITSRAPGKGGAVKTGMEEAAAEHIVFMDADNATPISEIEKFWQYFDRGFSVVIGSRYLKDSNVTQKQPLYRVVLSRAANLLIRFLAIPGIRDTQLGFKAFTKEAAHSIFKQVTITGWGFDMEVLTVAKILDYKIMEVPVLWREFGGSTVPMKAYIQCLRDLLKIKIKMLTGGYNEKGKNSEAVA